MSADVFCWFLTISSSFPPDKLAKKKRRRRKSRAWKVFLSDHQSDGDFD
jgi:hypothetical protein